MRDANRASCLRARAATFVFFHSGGASTRTKMTMTMTVAATATALAINNNNKLSRLRAGVVWCCAVHLHARRRLFFPARGREKTIKRRRRRQEW